MATYIWIAIGGALGSVGRHALNGFVTVRAGGGFPLGTMLINVAGSFAIGIFAALTAASGRWPADDNFRKFFMVGICGGFTTFSAFSLQTFELAQQGQWLRATANVLDR